jgi:hypothetical protein
LRRRGADAAGGGRSAEISPLRDPHAGHRDLSWCITEMRRHSEQM